MRITIKTLKYTNDGMSEGKRWKNRYLTLLFIVLSVILSACNQPVPKVTGYLIGACNNVLIIYDNGEVSSWLILIIICDC